MNKIETKPIRTMCPMNCHPTLCGMVVKVTDGKLIEIAGDKDNPDSKGFLCVRGLAAKEIIGNHQRLLNPLIRENREKDNWRRADWNEALDLIAVRMRDAGPGAVGFWPGHGNGANDYGVGVKWQLIERFANLFGAQRWNPAMICWGLGGFGIGITGALETSTKEDMGRNSELIVLWAANLTSQPNTAPHIKLAKQRGAKVVTIDVRRTEATAQSDEVYLIKPGTDAALALALINVIISEKLHDADYIEQYTVGFDKLGVHAKKYTPEWAAALTGLKVDRIIGLARQYATTKPAMLVIGGSSLHKGSNSWTAARAISCLPAVTGNFGKLGGGIGPRHGSTSHGRGMGNITAINRRKPGTYIPNQMGDVVRALNDGKIQVLMLPGCNILSSFPDTRTLMKGLEKVGLIISTDLFMSETIHRVADVVLPSTSWLEEIGCKATNTHLYLMDKVLDPPGETRPLYEILKGLAERLGIEEFYPWSSHENAINAVLDHPATGHASISSLRANNGNVPLNISHVSYPTHEYHTPSGKIEFFSAQAGAAGLPALPEPAMSIDENYPLTLCQGRTLTQFHSFYSQGQALPSLAKHNAGPVLWMSPEDATKRKLRDGDTISIFNDRGKFTAKAYVSDKILGGTVWMRDGWVGLNNVTSGSDVLPDAALNLFPFTVGQTNFGAQVDVAGVSE